MASKVEPLSKRSAKRIASLGRRKYRERYGQCIVEGVRSVGSALRAGARIRELVVSERGRDEEAVRRLIEAADCPVRECDDPAFARLSDVETPQGVLAVAEIAIEEGVDPTVFDRILVLDAVQDPGNAGTLMRTAAWFGVDCVVAGKGTVDLFNPKVMRAGAGAHWELSIRTHPEVGHLIDRVRSAGFASYAADVEGRSVDRWTPELPSVLVLGNEGHGISDVVRRRVDRRLTIERPPSARDPVGGVESLNVAVASGILLYRWLG